MGVKKIKSFIERANKEEIVEDLKNNSIILERIERDILSFLRSLVVAYSKHDKEFIEYSTRGLEKISPWKSEIEITNHLNEESVILDDNPVTTSECQVIKAMKFLSKIKMVKKSDGEGWRITAKGVVAIMPEQKKEEEQKAYKYFIFYEQEEGEGES